MGQFDVGIHALRGDVRIWDQQSRQMKQVVDKADALRMDRLEAGIFQIFVSAYHDAVAQIVGRSDEAGPAMHAVATTLTSVANAYQQDEDEHTHRFKDLR